MNKIITILVFIMALTTSVQAQVGIGTSSPDASAALDVSATDKGFLMPRMTTVQREAIASPATGLMVFDTDTNSYWSYVEAAWVEDKPGEGKFVEGGAPDIAYYESRVGIGMENFSTVHKLYVEGDRNDEGANTTARIDAIYNGTGTSALTIGVAATAKNNSTGTITTAVGSFGLLENVLAGTIVTGVGSWGEIDNQGTINTAVGSWPQISNQGTMNYAAGVIASITNTTGSINLVRGQDTGVTNESGGTMTQPSLASFYFTNEGTITGDGYGLFIGGGGNGTVGGNSYALYLSTPFSNVAGNAFALYSDNVNNSYFAGNLGIGELDPQQKVHINGVMRLEPQATPPTTGGAGDLYAGTDNKLYFHDGTSWKEIQLVP